MNIFVPQITKNAEEALAASVVTQEFVERVVPLWAVLGILVCQIPALIRVISKRIGERYVVPATKDHNFSRRVEECPGPLGSTRPESDLESIYILRIAS